MFSLGLVIASQLSRQNLPFSDEMQRLYMPLQLFLFSPHWIFEQNPKRSSETYKLREKATDLLFPMKEEHSSLFSFSVSCSVVWGVPPSYTLSQPVLAIKNIVILSCCKHGNHVAHLDDSINSINVCYCHNNCSSVGAKTRKSRN